MDVLLIKVDIKKYFDNEIKNNKTKTKKKY